MGKVETSLVARGAEALLERDGELRELAGLAGSARAGRGATALIEGPPGIGKTRLVEAAGSLADEYGLTALSARGGELEREIAFGIVRQLFERRLAAADARERDLLLAGAARLAAPVLDLAADAQLAGDDGGSRVLHGLYWLTANLAERQPLAILIDDLHWADAASLRFLLYLGRRARELPLFIVAARRPAEAAAAGQLHSALEREVAAVKLEPEPLTVAAASALVRDSLGADPDPALALALHDAAGGNPFLLGEVIEAMRDEGLPLDAPSARRIGDLMPRGVSRQIVLRLGRLPAAASALARAVAVLGMQAELRHAAALARLEPEQAAVASDALAAAAILRPGAPLEFVHPLVRSATYGDIPDGERTLAHRDAARLLAADDADATRLAIHWLAVPPTGDREAVAALRAAGVRAVERGTPASAAEYLRRALAEPPREEERGDLLAELGRAELQSGQPEEGIAHLEQAMEASGGARERSRIAHDLAMGLIAPGRYLDAVRMLGRAADEAAAVDPDLAAGLEAELITAALMRHDTTGLRLEYRRRLPREFAGTTPGQRALLAAMSMERLTEMAPVGEAAELARRAYEGGLTSEQGGHSGLVISCLYTLIVTDRLELAERAAEEAFSDVRARGSVVGVARIACFRAMLALRAGSIADAESFARESVEVGREPGYRIASMALGPLVEALAERGELHAAWRLLEEAGFDTEVPDTYMHNFVLFARGRLRLAGRRAQEAAADLEEFGRREGDWRADNPACFAWRSLLAGALLQLGDAGRATRLARQELEFARRIESPRAIGVALRTAGLSAGGTQGLALLRESVASLEDTPAQLELARSRIELGAAVRRAGERSAAREPLREGMELAHICGAAALVGRAREELVATGARPRRIMRTGLDALTPSELRVARLAGQGMTNREIAQALFVTLRTVEVHLTHTYQKLDISSREELAGALESG